VRATVLAAVSMSLVLSACRSTESDLPPEYRNVAVPAAWLATPEATQRGSELFARYCTLCHGVRGDGRGLQREGLTPPPRDFTDPAWRASTSPRRVYFAIREGRRGTAMPSWKSLSEQDDWALTGYVLSLAPSK
jgi:mono/diheme cytochrome c family protein